MYSVAIGEASVELASRARDRNLYVRATCPKAKVTMRRANVLERNKGAGHMGKQLPPQ